MKIHKEILRRIAKILLIVLIIVFLTLLFTDLALRFFVPLDGVRNKLLALGHQYTSREMKAERIEASLFGVYVKGFKMAAGPEGIDAGTFLQADELVIRFSVFDLLCGHYIIKAVTVNGLQVEVVREKDGSFNFDTIQPLNTQDAPPADASVSADPPPDLRITHLTVNHSNLVFRDLVSVSELEVKELYFSVKDFSFWKPFRLSANTTLRFIQGNGFVVTAPIGISLTPNLQNLDLQKASSEINLFTIRHEGGVFNFKGLVENFTNPSVKLTADITFLSDKILYGLVPDVPEFVIPHIHLDSVVRAELDRQRYYVDSLVLELLSSSVSLSGEAELSDPAKPQFQINTDFSFALQPFSHTISLLGSYELFGKLAGNITANNRDLSGKITLQEVGVTVPQAGHFSEVHTEVTLENLGSFSMPSLKGKLNGNLFAAELTSNRTKEQLNVNLQFSAEKLVLKDLSTPAKPTLSTSAAPVVPVVTEKTVWPLPPISLNADITVGSLEAPYFLGNNLVFRADLQGLTPTLQEVQGDFSLVTAPGQIQDLYKLTNANALTKVLFMSVNVVGKVVNSLNVFSVLSNLGKGVLNVGGNIVSAFSGNDGGETASEPVQKMDGKLDFDSFDTAIHFKDGKAMVKKGAFSSDMISFSIQGTTDFKTDQIDLTVNAAPGNHQDNGIMPLTISIGGTTENPQGKMSIFSTATSFITQPITNNFVTNTFRKGVNSVIGGGADASVVQPAPSTENALNAGDETANFNARVVDTNDSEALLGQSAAINEEVSASRASTPEISDIPAPQTAAAGNNLTTPAASSSFSTSGTAVKTENRLAEPILSAAETGTILTENKPGVEVLAVPVEQIFSTGELPATTTETGSVRTYQPLLDKASSEIQVIAVPAERTEGIEEETPAPPLSATDARRISEAVAAWERPVVAP